MSGVVRRTILSALFAFLAAGGALFLFMTARNKVQHPQIAEEAKVPETAGAARFEEKAILDETTPEPLLAGDPDAPPEPESITEVPWSERPIEEVLAEAGEDPGAVFYMSRIRESIREGSPTFARELLRQMKERHPNSVLVEEAEHLFESGRGRP